MSMASTIIRSTFRSTTSFRISPSKFAPRAAFQLPKPRPASQCTLLRSPVELSCCVESLMPFHTTTSSALLTSLISDSHRACWLREGLDKTR
ncbi:hypothetical protein ACHQM5_017574 [Ranunculus cassubicifolius]